MADEVQVLVRFTTKLPNDLRVPDTEVVRGPAFGDIGCLWQLATAVLLLHRRCRPSCHLPPPPTGRASVSQALWTVTNY
jgi:hypothetical protein